MSGLLSERDFVILWLVNLVAAVLYLLVGALVVSPLRMRKEKKASSESQTREVEALKARASGFRRLSRSKCNNNWERRSPPLCLP